MYKSINNYLIAKRKADTATTASGIILDANDKLTFTVVEAPLNWTSLQNKNIIINNEVVAYKLPDKIHYSINVENIVAVEE